MVSTSFQPVQAQAAQATQQQPLAMRQGQMFHGTIKQLYPDQTAEIQVGNQKIIAKLEAPLKQGDSHVFQVTQTQPQTELKVVTNAVTPQQQMQQVMSALNLSKTAEMQQVVQHFMKAQLPLAKEQLIAAESFLKNLPEGISVKEALTAMTKMIEGKMPFTQEVFHAMTQGAKTSGMVATMQQLHTALQSDTLLPAQTKAAIQQQLQQIAKPFNEQAGGMYVAKLVEQLQNGTAMQKQEALAVLKQAGILPQQATTTQWQQNVQAPSLAINAQAGQVVQALQQTTPQQVTAQLPQLTQWVEAQSTLSEAQKQPLQQLIQRFAALPQTPQTLAIFTKQFNEQLIKAFSATAQTQIFPANGALSANEQLMSLISSEKNLANSFTQAANIVSNNQQMQQLVVQTESLLQNNLDGKAIEHAMRHIMREMGMSYEASLKANDPQLLATQLKPQLLAMLQDPMLTQTKDAAEMMLARLNGMQLQSGDNGHQHQLVMQVPLEFLGKKSEATMQWNGRMQEDGKIDADYARILFYLDMESLSQTMIDMQVQNRVVTVNIFNEHTGLQALATPLQEALQQGLAKNDYQLSGVFLKPFDAQKPSPKKPQIEPTLGVDLRV